MPSMRSRPASRARGRSRPARPGSDGWRRQYALALSLFLRSRAEDERHLQRAYEIGRQALAERSGLLELVTLHADAVTRAFASRAHAPASRRAASKSGAFLTEAISAYEMTHRAFDEANTALRNVHTYIEQNARRTAYALHDGAGQLLAAVYMQLSDVGRELPPRQRRRLRETRALLEQIEEQLRAIAHEIRPPLLDDLGLVPALRGLGESFGRRTGIRVVVEAGESPRMPSGVETALYRIAQEALNNVQKHARASHVRLALRERPGSAELCVIDDGVGFDAAAILVERRKPGLGLSSIRERAESLGGRAHFTSAPGRGTQLEVRIPLEVVHADPGHAGRRSPDRS